MFVHGSAKYVEVLFAGSDTFPTKEVVRNLQEAAAGNGPTLDTVLGVALLDSEGLYRVEYHGHRVIWVAGRVPEEATAGVCPPGEGRTPRGRCKDASA